MDIEIIDMANAHDATVMLVHIESQIRAARNLYQQVQNMTLTQNVDAKYELLDELEKAGMSLNKMKAEIVRGVELRAFPLRVRRI